MDLGKLRHGSASVILLLAEGRPAHRSAHRRNAHGLEVFEQLMDAVETIRRLGCTQKNPEKLHADEGHDFLRYRGRFARAGCAGARSSVATGGWSDARGAGRPAIGGSRRAASGNSRGVPPPGLLDYLPRLPIVSSFDALQVAGENISCSRWRLCT